MQKTEVTCDHCAKDVTAPIRGYHRTYLTVSSSHGKCSEIMFAVYEYPGFWDQSRHFCDEFCLMNFVKAYEKKLEPAPKP